MTGDRIGAGGAGQRGRWVPWLLLVAAVTLFYAAYFSPVLLQQRYLAPGDGEVYYLPFFGLPVWDAWTPLILSGSPILNDIQSQLLYPVRWLSPTFNVLVVSAYVIAAVGMFALALRVTGSRLGALAAAAVVSGSGFMVGHLGHLSIIHAAAWIPWMLWATAGLRKPRRGWAVFLGSLAVALCIYGGHPQVSIAGLLLAGCYALHEAGVVWHRDGRGQGVRVLLAAAAMFACGLLLAAPVLLPFMQTAADGVRSNWSTADFNSYSHVPGTLRMLFFPNIYGAHGASPFGAYPGTDLTELAIYAGLGSWVLAWAAVLGWKRDRSHWFWIGALVVALLLTLGTVSPLGRLLYELPVVGKFRAQARFGILAIIALGMLSAFGISALLRERWSARRYLWLLGGAGLFFVAVVIWGLRVVPAVTLASTSMRLAIALMAASLLGVGLLAWKRSMAAALALVLLLVVDVASFGWFYEWKYPSATSTVAGLEPQTQGLVQELADGEGRLLPLNAAKMGVEPIRPNVNMRHGIPSVVGYGPLVTARYMAYAGADTVGGFGSGDPAAPVMDVLGVQWIAGATSSMDSQLLGQGCGVSNPLRKLRVRIPDGVSPSSVTVVSHLSCSTAVMDKVDLAQVAAMDGGGQVLVAHPLQVGIHTGEWAYDRADVRAAVAHSRPQVAETFDGGGFQGLWFKGEWQLPGGVAEIQIQGQDHPEVPMRVKGVWITDATGAQVQLPMQALYEGQSGALGPERSVPGLPPIQRRLAFRGMAWTVCDVRGAGQAQIIAQLRGELDADGQRLDPFRTALIEETVAAPAVRCESPPRVDVTARRAGHWTLALAGQAPGFLVVSESYNRDWTAQVDGVPVAVVPTYGLVLGVPLPAGAREVVLDYRPRSFHRGLILAGLGLLGAVAWLWPWRTRGIGKKQRVNT